MKMGENVESDSDVTIQEIVIKKNEKPQTIVANATEIDK
jgi:hypothetical protein